MKTRQQGYVLLVLMALILSAGVGIAMTGLSKTVIERKAAGERKVLAQLKNVKQRLLTYAATHPEIYVNGDPTKTPGPGYFPCPTTTANAVAEGSCSGDTSRGWLPRKLTGRGVSFEAEGLDWSRVWFVLDNRFAVNTDSAGCGGLARVDSRCRPLNTAFAVDRLELNSQTGYVALLIYAGQSMAGQTRATAVPDVEDYLEGENSDNDDAYSTVAANMDEAFNDIVLPITADEWAAIMEARVSSSAGSGNWCSGGAPDWFTQHEWDAPARNICE